MSDEKLPVVNAEPMSGGSNVQVVAPTDLMEGYKLEVAVNGETKSVTVPPGGVKEGQSFSVTVDEQPAAAAGGGGKSSVHHEIPSGKWRDGLCDCFNFGPCHAMCWFAWCFTPVVAGQVMTRMSRDFLGNPGDPPSTSSTCKTVTAIMIAMWLCHAIFQIVMDSVSCWGIREVYDQNLGEFVWQCPDGSTIETSTAFEVVRAMSSILGLIYIIYLVFAICTTRRAIRDKYNIPPGSCGAMDDCCCSYWCMCCTVQQMARHTNDYRTYDVNCCSNDCCNKRGQPDIVPEIV